MVAFAATAGASPSEMVAVTVADVGFAAATVLVPEKEGRRGRRTTRRVPMAPRLVAVSRESNDEHPGGRFLLGRSPVVERIPNTGSKNKSQTPNDGRIGTSRATPAPQGPPTRDEAHDHLLGDRGEGREGGCGDEPGAPAQDSGY